MEYWREEGMTARERRLQDALAEIILDIGLDLACECRDLRADDCNV